MFIDTHCHLDEYENLDEITNFDGYMITSGCDTKTNKQVIKIIDKYDNVFGTLGIHPENIDNVSEKDYEFIEKNINNKKIVAIGEIGLDYHYTSDNKEKQIEVLKRQLDIAQKYNLPVVIHSRDAILDTYNILKEYNLKGTIHCFSSSLEMAKEFIKLGYKIGVGGVLTFKNGKKLQEIVKTIDLQNILIETDSPYLSPEPFRGKKNKPSNVLYVAKKISEIKQISIENVLNIVNQNAISEFDLSI